ncbi:MAG TPA: M3 family metallopeptidase [Bacteroidales bacterium]|nr:M3 family metallopeptidase [Bacteroidales bacterium]HOX77983.1 M3 family metallopeptidase [Bacteroidales bacterium]HPI87191.1 M3 family metallopeptidase [Bacteroidales bacterium]HPM92796.1 M3 family metallopeptidase [Bacteroidales bacterium]
MRTLFGISLLLMGIITSCTTGEKKMKTAENPFFAPYGTPFETAAFDRIKNEHFLPAFHEGIRVHDEEIAAIVANPAAPDFENTIVALDRSGDLLAGVSGVFYNLTSANTNDELQSIAKEISPVLTGHYDNILLNAGLFKRIKAVYEQRDNLNLDTEQAMLLEKTYKQFARGGSNLPDDKQATLREINKELSMLSLQFGDNLLAETNAFRLVIDNESDLEGLPAFVRDAAASAAREDSLDGKWLFTLHSPSRIPFLQFSAKRELREKVLKAYANRGNNNNQYDNKEIAAKMASLRVKKANLLGYATHADYILEENMAKNPAAVYDFLDKVWSAALPVAKKEAAELQAMIDAEGGNFKLEAWDWWYYAEKLRKQKYDLDEEALKPYFSLENVRLGMFDVATRLFGITFTERNDIQKYHPEVKVFEVKDTDGSHIGILYMDFFPRASKEGGAWMNNYRDQYMAGDSNVSPVITTVCNFTKPAGDVPSLLTFEEVETLFHEFGHALHGLLSECRYRKLSGTSTPRDFVELPSQIMENWAGDPEVMKLYARHYQTGEVIPQELIDKITASGHFNQGFATVEYMAACYLDMDIHTLKDSSLMDALGFESASMSKIGMMPEIIVRYRVPYFAHIFAGGYSSGYYSYLWAEVLDADAFQAFKETGIFDPATAKAFRDNILSRGGTDDPMKLYKQFRGKEPDVAPMLKRKGLI